MYFYTPNINPIFHFLLSPLNFFSVGADLSLAGYPLLLSGRSLSLARFQSISLSSTETRTPLSVISIPRSKGVAPSHGSRCHNLIRDSELQYSDEEVASTVMPEIFWCSCSGCWDLRDSPPSPAFQNSKAHTMGVCCIVKSPYDPNVLFTSSYDEHLRVWDMRSTSKPVNEASVCLGGGVWRIKCHPSEPNLVLAACMHNGFAIVEMDEEKLQVKEIYSKHGLLAYGADWQRGSCSHGGNIKNSAFATCSFYDKMLRLWIPQNDNL